MPQSGFTPQGDTAVGGNSFVPPVEEEKKKRKPAPAPVYTPPTSRIDDPRSTQMQVDTDASASKAAAQIDRQTSRYLKRTTLLNAQERQGVLDTLSKRADAVDSRLLSRDPSLAVEFITGSIPTHKLSQVTSAAADGAILQGLAAQREAERQYHVGLTENDINQTFAPPGWSAVQSNAVTREYWEKGLNIKDPQQRAWFLEGVMHAASLPAGEKRDTEIEFLTKGYAYAQDGQLEDPNTSMLGKAVENVGKTVGGLFTIPVGLASKGMDLFDSDTNKQSGILDAIQEGFGDALGAAGTAANFYARNAQGLAVGAAETLVMRVPRELGGLVGADEYANSEPTGGFLSADELWTSWDEAGGAGSDEDFHSPFTAVLGRAMGTTADDPRYQGLFAFTDMTVDFAGQAYGFKALMAMKTVLRNTIAGGGVITSEALVNSRLLGGVRLVNTGWNTIRNLPTAQRAVALTDKFKKGMTPTLAEDLATATTRDEYARLLAKGIDEVPDNLIAEAERRIAAIDRAVGTDPAAAAPEGYSVDLKGQRLNKSGEAVGDIPASEVQWVDTAEFADDSITRLTRRESAEPGSTLGDYASGLSATKRFPKPIEVLIGEDGRLEVVDGNHTLTAAEMAGIGKVPVRFVTPLPEGLSLQEAARQSYPAAQHELSSARGAELDLLQAEKISLEQKILELSGRETIYEFPRISHMRPFMRGSVGRGIGGRAGRLLNHIFGEAGKFDLSKLTDDLTPDANRLIDPSALDKVRGWASENFDALRKTMNAAKVPKATQRIILEQMAQVERGNLSFIDWRRNIELAYREGLGKNITAEAEAAIRVASDRTITERMHSPVEDKVTLPNGRTDSVLHAIASDADGNPLPTRPTQVLQGEVSLPDMRTLTESTSMIRAFDAWAKNQPGAVGKVLGGLSTTGSIAHFALLELPRLVLRPALLAERAVLGRLGVKIEFDQSIRAWLAEGVTPLDWWRRSKVDFTEAGLPIRPGLRQMLTNLRNPRGDVTPLGLVVSEVMDDVSYERREIPTRGGLDQVDGKNAKRIAQGVYDHIRELQADPLTRKIALEGPERALAYIEAHPNEHWVRVFNRDVAPGVINRAGMTLPTLMRELEREIDQATGLDPALREAVGTGTWHVGRGVQTTYAKDRVLVEDEIVEAKDNLRTTEDGIARRQLLLRIEELESRARWLGDHDVTGDALNLADEHEFTGQVLNNWREKTFQMPDRVIVREPKVKSLHDGDTVVEKFRTQAQRLNRQLYKGFKPMQRVTANMSRGSTFRKVMDRVYETLVKQGYDPDTAFLEAQHRAAFITKDLHYDISARSSVDRKLQNYFWFSPVWREQLSTYLVKLPQKAFWAPGIILEFGMAHTIMQGLQDMGLAETRTTFVDDQGNETKELFIGGVSVTGLDPLSPGTEAGHPPTLSPGAENILDFTAKWSAVPEPVRNMIKGVSEALSFDGDIQRAANMIPFDTTRKLIGEAASALDKNKVEWQVRAYAEEQLAEEGITDPTPAQLESAVRELEGGMFFVHLLGSLVLPGKLVTEGTDPWYSYREQALHDANTYTDLALRHTQDWSTDEPAPELKPEDSIDDFKSLTQRQQATRAAYWTQLPPEDLTPTQEQVLGGPAKYTVARRMAISGYFKGEVAGWSLAKADSLKRRILAEGNSPNGYAEATLELKAKFYNTVDERRLADPDFDRQLRYLELGVSTGQYISRTEAYELIFFGEPYSSDVVPMLEKERERAD